MEKPLQRASAALLSSVALALAACSDDPAPPATASHSGVLARLVTDAHEEPAANREVVEIAGFRMTEKNRDVCPWESRGPQERIMTLVRPPGGSEDRSRFLPAVALRGGGPKSFTHRFEFEARQVTTVEAYMTCYGLTEERARLVTLDASGEVAEATEWETFQSRTDPRQLTFRMPLAPDGFAKRTGIRLEFEGLLEHAALLAMRALETPPGALLPVVGTGQSLRGGAEWRHAAGLIEGSPWTVDVTNDEADAGALQLGFDVWIPVPADLSPKNPRIELRAQGKGGPIEQTLEVPRKASSSWTRVTVDLSDLESGASSVQLALLDDDPDHESSVAIGDAVVTQRARGARTVLFITSDTHRRDHLGSANAAAFVDTPTLDRLGRRGLFFTNCQATTNVTNPSHIAMLTGIHPRDTQIVNNKTQIAESVNTLAEIFQANGYRTFASISTQHLDPSQSGLGQGFDRFEAPETFKRSGNVSVDQIGEWMDEADGQSVFAWLHVFDAHAPYGPPAKFRERATKGISSKREGGIGYETRFVPEWITVEGLENPDYIDALYRGEVDWVDEALRELLAAPRLKDATILFTSDHGESLRTHSVYWDHAGLYLPMVEVPMILVDPRIEARRTDVSVQQIDVGRTLLDLAGIDAPFAGRNLVTLAEESAADEPRYAIAAHGLQASVTSGKWFLVLDLQTLEIETAAHRWTKGRAQLFDRTRGTDTEDDLAAEFPDITDRLRTSLITFLEDASLEGLGQSSEINAAAEANLQALGYAAFGERTATRWWVPDSNNGESEQPDRD